MSWKSADCASLVNRSFPSSTRRFASTRDFHADLVVEDAVIVEIKSLETIAPVHRKQLLTYLKLADKRLGLLINFNVALIKDGITRIVNGLKE
jgi:GxxExxY protein